MDAPHIVLFDLFAGGHHGQYIRQLVAHWAISRLRGRLTVLATDAFFDRHAEITRLASEIPSAALERVPMEEQPTFSGVFAGPRTHGRVLREAIPRLRPTHVLCMYYDQVQLSLALGLRFGFPLRMAGIYFRPTFHYARLDAETPRSRVTDLRKRLLLQASLRNPHVDTLFLPGFRT